MIPASSRRLGVMGGTFDPLHLGHLIVAHDVAERLGLDRVLLVLSARPPLKNRAPAPAELRLEMLEAALGDDSALVPSDLEVRRAGPSYMIDTLQELHVQHPGAELVLVIGVDQWQQLEDWKDPQGIARLATIAVMAREGEEPKVVHPGLAISARVVPVTRVDISATEVRARAQRGRSIKHLVPDEAHRIIEREALYASPAVQPALQGR